jgi:hypothetical protein
VAGMVLKKDVKWDVKWDVKGDVKWVGVVNKSKWKSTKRN